MARTRFAQLYLGAAKGELSTSPFKEEAQIRYDVNDLADKNQSVFFGIKFKAKTELTGHAKLRLWVEAVGSDDMDLYVVIDKLDRTGDRVCLPSQSAFDHGPVAYGWLRVSHRELDEERSTPYQPVLKHHRQIKLKAGEIVPVEIELWATSMLFEAGETLRVTVLGSDLHAHEAWTHTAVRTVNRGTHVIHAVVSTTHIYSCRSFRLMNCGQSFASRPLNRTSSSVSLSDETASVLVGSSP